MWWFQNPSAFQFQTRWSIHSSPWFSCKTQLKTLDITYNGVRNSSPLQYSCLGSSMDRGAWWATVHGVPKSRTQLTFWAHMHSHVHQTRATLEGGEKKAAQLGTLRNVAVSSWGFLSASIPDWGWRSWPPQVSTGTDKALRKVFFLKTKGKERANLARQKTLTE